MSWDDIIERMFCDISNLQALCPGCHKEKTDMENEKRKEYKYQRKREEFAKRIKYLNKGDLKVKYKDEHCPTPDMFLKTSLSELDLQLYGCVVFCEGNSEFIVKDFNNETK